MRTRVKICGITRVQDARAACAAGADAIGLVFFPDSPRYVMPETAAGVARAVAPFVTVTGLFVNAQPLDIEAVLARVPLGLLQFHGQEDNAACARFGLPFIKSVAVRAGVDCAAVMDAYPDAAGFLFDAWLPDIHGGGGVSFDWSDMPAAVDRPLILAGGLDPDNVGSAIRATRPYAVDVSSGVETAKGIKSADKINAFMRGVIRSDTDQYS